MGSLAGVFKMWVIYDHPKDYPDHYVARLWYSEANHPQPIATNLTLIESDIETIRGKMRRCGLVCSPRSTPDDPVIMEVWY